jgi:hypothetical protein
VKSDHTQSGSLSGPQGRLISDLPRGLERLYTIDQIVRAGGPCRAKLYMDIKAGRLKAIKFGRSTRITESSYRAYIEAAPVLSGCGQDRQAS